MKKIKLSKTISIIISITFILFSFLGNVHFCCFDENFYTNEHNKITLYGKPINEHIGISNDELKELTSFTLNYLNDYDLTLDKQMKINGYIREVFTDDEKLHMEDVRRLNINSVYICIITGIIFMSLLLYYLISKLDKGMLFIEYKKVLMYTLLFFSFLGIWVLIDFDSFWTLFHKIFFTGNDLWLLDLRKDILIMIVPPDFFMHLVIRILLNFIISIVLFGIFIYIIARKKIDND